MQRPSSDSSPDSRSPNAPKFRLPSSMQNIAAFVQQVCSTNEDTNGGEAAAAPSTSGSTFSIRGGAGASAAPRPSSGAGRGGKAPASSGNGGALSRNTGASSDDGLEATVAGLALQSPQTKKTTAHQEQQLNPSKQQLQQQTEQQPQSQQKQLQSHRHDGQKRSEVQRPPQQQQKQEHQHQPQQHAAPSDSALSHGSASADTGAKSSRQDRQQDQAKKGKEASSAASGNKQRAGSEAVPQPSDSAASGPSKHDPEPMKTKQQPQDRQQQQPNVKAPPRSGAASSRISAVEAAASSSFHVCGLCASGYGVAAVHPCGHRDVCAKCDLKMRTVVKDRRCCFCKNATETVIYAAVERQESFRELLPMCLQRNDEWGAVFDCAETEEAVHDLIALGCPVCKTKFADETCLKTHVRSVHRLQYCSVCLEQRTALLCEQTLYSEADLKCHMLGHPKCRFCRVSFLDDDKLFVHMERNHLRCHLCHQAGQVYQYFTNLDSFRAHCGERHFVCRHPECNIDQCRVFASAVELADHELDHNAGSVSRSERARVLQVAFWGATGSQPSFNEDDVARQRPGRGRGGNAAREAAPTGDAAASGSVEQWPGLGGAASSSDNSMASAYPPPVSRQELDAHFPALPGSEEAVPPERHRRQAADRAVAASSEVPWLRDLTRPLSPFTQPDAMMKRNKDLAVRIKEELAGPERSQEAVTIGWQRFKQLTTQFSSGEIDSSCYLSSFLSLFPNDPHRRHTERRCGMLRELATTCPRNREELQAAYLHIVRSFAGGRDAAPAIGSGPANAGKTAAAVIKGTLSSNVAASAKPRAPQELSAEFPALPSSAPVRPVVNWGLAAGAASSDPGDAPSAAARVRKMKTSRGDVLLL